MTALTDLADYLDAAIDAGRLVEDGAVLRPLVAGKNAHPAVQLVVEREGHCVGYHIVRVLEPRLKRGRG